MMRLPVLSTSMPRSLPVTVLPSIRFSKAVVWMPAPSPVLLPLRSQVLPMMKQELVARMPSPRQPCTVQRSTVLAPATLMPMPVLDVKMPAVESMLLTTHCETRHSVPVRMPPEVVATLVLACTTQPMSVQALPVKMPAAPPFDSAVQFISVTLVPMLKPSPVLLRAAQFCSVPTLPTEKPMPPLTAAAQFTRMDPPADPPETEKPLAVFWSAEQLVNVQSEPLMNPLLSLPPALQSRRTLRPPTLQPCAALLEGT